MKINKPSNRLIGDMPKVGIRPTIDGRRRGVRPPLSPPTAARGRGPYWKVTGKVRTLLARFFSPGTLSILATTE